MKQKVLFCATIDGHFKSFHLPYLKWFKDQGWEVHVAAYGNTTLSYVDRKFNIPIQRSPLKLKNWKAYKELQAIIAQNDYQIIHCHTPMGGVLARLAARKARKNGTKVIYTAHGFHFYHGAPLTNWILYYPIEKILAKLTDCLITINDEDYRFATKHHFRAREINHVHGVGVDTMEFKPLNERGKLGLRKVLGYKSTDFIMFYAAEFNKNKNQQLLIEALASIKKDIPQAKLLLGGNGALLDTCRNLAKERGIDHMVVFLGYQDNIKPFLQISDIAVGSSLREGLPVNIMEAMSSGLPIIATKNRGHSELVENGGNGFIILSDDFKIFASRILQLYNNHELREKMGQESIKRMEAYSLNQVSLEMKQLYGRYLMPNESHKKSIYKRREE